MAQTSSAVLGIDVGTTAVKVVLVAEDGNVLTESEVEQPVSVPRPGWTEQDPETWWGSTKAALHEVMGKAKNLSQKVEVTAIGLSGQMHSSVTNSPVRR